MPSSEEMRRRAKKAARTKKRLYGDDFFSEMAKRATGKKRNGSGFGSTKIGPDGLTGAERSAAIGRRNAGRSRKPVDPTPPIPGDEGAPKGGYKRYEVRPE